MEYTRSVAGLLLAFAMGSAAGASDLNHTPDCSSATAAPEALWPPNHGFSEIAITGIADPDGDALSLSVQCILQDEPGNATGDGNFEPDAGGIGAPVAQVRRERAGNRNGRVYHIDFIATDSRGARCGGEVRVSVPKSAKKPAVDDGRLYAAVPSPYTCGLHDINNPPLIVSEPLTFLQEGAAYRYAVHGHDPDRDPLRYALAEGPTGLVIDARTGVLNGTVAAAGRHPVRVRVEDGRGGTAEQAFTLDVNTRPVIGSSPVTLGQTTAPYRYAVDAGDADGDALTYALTVAPAGMVVDALGVITWPAPERGTHGVTVRVEDARGGSVAQIFDLIINAPPAITSSPVTAGLEGQPYRYAVEAVDPDGDPLGYVLARAPAGMTIDGAGVIAWANSSRGVHPVTVVVDDGRDGSAEQSFTLTVNGLPAITSTPIERVQAGSPYRYAVVAEDPDGDALGYSLPSAPAGMSIDPAGVVTWPEPAGGRHSVVVRVEDARGGAVEQAFVLVVNRAPEFIGEPVTEAPLGQPYTYALQIRDPDGDSLSFSLPQAPAGMRIDAVGVVTWPEPAGGSHAVVIRAEDGYGGSAEQAFTLTVDSPPAIASSPVTAGVEGEPYHYAVDAADPDGDALTYTLPQAPAGMVVDAAGLIAWPDPSRGNHPVAVTVDDGRGGRAEQRYTLIINGLPVITSTPIERVQAGSAYRYAVVAEDPDGDALHFSLPSAPAGMGIDTAGVVTWPEPVGGSHAVVVRVEDGRGAVVEQAFTLVVNRAPEFSGEPLTEAPLGQPYTYAVKVHDPDGDSLSFSLPQAPVGMIVDATGVVTWPEPASGSHPVVIRVEDGNGGSAAQAFTLDVNSPPAITSSPLTSARSGIAYRYQVEAGDPDGDPLTYQLTSAPAGMSVDAIGVIEWAAPVHGEHPVAVRVEDGRGGEAEQRYVLAVTGAAPSIVSQPATAVDAATTYQYAVAATDPDGDPLTYTLLSGPADAYLDPASGALSWYADPAYAQPQSGPDPYCLLRTTRREPDPPAAADVIAVVDESGSMEGEQAWIAAVIPELEAALMAEGVGAEGENLYGLVGFGHSWNPLRTLEMDTSGRLLGTAEEFSAVAAGRLVAKGAIEDGYRALQLAMGAYPRRDPVARNLVLVTDEDRDEWHNESPHQYPTVVTFDQTLTRLLEGRYVLNAVILGTFHCADGRAALGIDAAYNGYIADGNGGFELCADAAATSGEGTTLEDYVDLALATGGAAWDLSYLRQGGLWAASFSAAFVAVKTGEIVKQTDTHLADLALSDLRLDHGTGLILGVSNRGGAAVETEHRVRFYAGADASGEFLGEVPLAPLAAHAHADVHLPLVSSPAGTELFAALDPAPGGRDCHTENDTLRAPLLRVGVSDSGGQSDSQSFVLNVQESNRAPRITSDPPPVGYYNIGFRYPLSAEDPNRADGMGFTLIEGPEGMTVDYLSGLLEWPADAAQPGTYPVTVEVADSAGLSDRQTYAITFEQALPPTLDIPYYLPKGKVGEPYQYQLRASSHRGASLRYKLMYPTPGLQVDAESGLLTWLPTRQNLNSGGWSRVGVTDADGLYAEATIFVSLNPAGEPPIISSEPPLEAEAGRLYRYQVEAADPEGGPLSYSLRGGYNDPLDIAIDPQSGLLTWTPPLSMVRRGITVTVYVEDDAGWKVEHDWHVWVVEPTNTAPTITSTPPTRVDYGGLYRYTLTATDAEGDDLIYRLEQAPAGMGIDAAGLIAWDSTGVSEGSYAVTAAVQDSIGAVTRQSWSIAVLPPPNQAPVVSSAPATSVAAGQGYRYQVLATDPDGDPLTYTLTAGPAGMVIDAGGALTWAPLEADTGSHPVAVRIADERGAAVTQSWTLEVLPPPNAAPGITSMPPAGVVAGEIYRYAVLAADPDGDPLTYSLTTAPAGMAIDADGLVLWAPDSEFIGSHPVAVRVDDGQGAAVTQSWSVQVTDQPNGAPTIHSSPPASAEADVAYLYLPEASDPEGDTLAWTLVQGPAGMTLDPASGRLDWNPTADQAGGHPVELRVSDGHGGEAWQAFSVWVITEADGNQPPQFTSGAPGHAVTDSAYQHPVTADDPDGDPLTYTLPIAPAGMALDPATGLLTWLPTEPGLFPIRVRVSDPHGGYAEQGYVLEVIDGDLPLEIALALDPPFLDIGGQATVTVMTRGGLRPVARRLFVDGSEVALDTEGRAVLTGTAASALQLRAEADDGREQVTTEGFLGVRDPADTEAPSAGIAFPTDGTLVSEPIDIFGSIGDANLAEYLIEIAPAGSPYYTTLARGTEPVSAGVLATLDPTRLGNGQYTLRLEATDSNGQQGVSAATVTVDGQMKVGHFSLTYEDLTLEVAGLPITVTRTYDTRRKAEPLAFGHGWSVGYQSIRVHENSVLGRHWGLINYGGEFGQQCVESNGERRVTVTLPDGQVERFRAVAVPECENIVPLVDVTLGFEPLGHTTATLEQSDYGLLRLADGQLVDLSDPYTPIDPQHYRLTTADGLVYELDQGFGVRAILEPGGERIDFTDHGITHSAGVEVGFRRDGAGRITQVTAPDGNALHYHYDRHGDLERVTDRAGHTGTYGYDRHHTLIDIIDARGQPVLRNEYDADGRLIAQVDAEGQRIELTHDIPGRQEIIRDRNGNATVYTYDGRGNVLTETNALGETTSHAYDAADNEISRTDPLGHTTSWTYDARGNRLSETDPLGNTTSWTYGERNEVLTETDALGRLVLEHRYDDKGKPTEFLDALGHDVQGCTNVAGAGCAGATTFGYDWFGHLGSITDAAGGLTAYTNDRSGRRLSERSPNGRVTDTTYDTNGNVLTETTTRTDADGLVHTLTTTYTVDANGNRTSVTDPHGNVSTTDYNAIGQVSAETDALGRTTSYTYDPAGRLIETVHPDGSSETLAYDANGNQRSETDRAGRTTTYTFDAADRLTRTTYPDGSSEERTYDAAGRLVALTDALGNTTTYGYDAAGRLTRETDAAGHDVQGCTNVAGAGCAGATTTYTYDAVGNRTSVTDPLGNVTRYTYDAAGRLLQTTHPDGSTRTIGYDPLGRKASETDPNGNTTTYQYGGVGDLIAVTDALGNTTTYGYDEQGNKLSQTDAEGRTTTWAYDDLGRPVSRTLPGGQGETFTYDAAGNRTGHTDFNGQSTTYGYDTLNRETTRTDADGHTVSTTYTASGQVDTVTDVHGTTDHDYDQRDRLTAIRYPNGQRIDYGYDARGQRITLSSGTHTVRYTYSVLGHLAGVTDPSGTTRYAYDAAGRLQSLAYPNGVTTEYAYDANGRLTRITTTDAQGTTLDDLHYTLDVAGRRTALTEHSGRSTLWSYDALDRLTGEQISDPATGTSTTTWTFDAVGNRLIQTRAGLTTTYTYDANDRLLSESRSDGRSTSYAYDDNGNTTETLTDGQRTTYTWNAANRLSAALTPTTALAYTYDASGIRQSRTQDGQTTTYLIDPNRPYAQVIGEYQDGVEQVRYTHGHDLLSQTRAGESRYFGYDGLGTTRSLTDSTGAASDRYAYSAFGELLTREGSTPNDFLYTGEQYDPGLGQYYLRARYMDPGVGRFVGMDAFAGVATKPITQHKHLYGNAAPTVFRDPSGYFGLMELGAANDVQTTLSGVQVQVGFDVLDSAFGVLGKTDAQETLRAAQTILGVAALGAGGIKLARLLSKKFRSGDVPDVKFGPHMKGPLGPRAASSFRGGVYTQKVLKEKTVLYRAWGGEASELGRYWTRQKPRGKLQNRMDCALLDEWGNSQASVCRIEVPKGAVIYEGFVAPQKRAEQELLGGASQVYIEMVDPAWVVK